MKTNRFVLYIFAIAGLACDSVGGNVSEGTGGNVLPDTSGTGGRAAGTTKNSTPALPLASPDSGGVIVPPATRPDADIVGATAAPLPPFACTADAFYMCEGDYNCDEGMIATWQCNSTGDDAVWVMGSDGESCECRSFGDVPDASVPTPPPTAKRDAAATPPSLTRDAGVADSATNDALKVDARTPDLAPDMLAKTPDATPKAPDLALPDTSVPIDLALPDTLLVAPQPDASVPDTASPDTALILPPDAMPDTMPADTFVPAPQPDVGSDSQIPDSMPLQSDAGCAITLSLTAPATTGSHLHCYTRTIYWSVVGCAPSGFRVTWSKTPGPGCQLRMSEAGSSFIDDYVLVSDPTVLSKTVSDSKGPGTYYFVVCEQNGDTCGPCSDDLRIDLTN